MEHNIIMSDDIVRQLNKIVEYLEQDEKRNFEESFLDEEFNEETFNMKQLSKEQKNHIFVSVLKVKQWLKADKEAQRWK